MAKALSTAKSSAANPSERQSINSCSLVRNFFNEKIDFSGSVSDFAGCN
jgi:hypothetical protein